MATCQRSFRRAQRRSRSGDAAASCRTSSDRSRLWSAIGNSSRNSIRKHTPRRDGRLLPVQSADGHQHTEAPAGARTAAPRQLPAHGSRLTDPHGRPETRRGSLYLTLHHDLPGCVPLSPLRLKPAGRASPLTRSADATPTSFPQAPIPAWCAARRSVRVRNTRRPDRLHSRPPSTKAVPAQAVGSRP